jgi:UDP-N-acetyl-D-mannosaminuronate dehydrogenase
MYSDEELQGLRFTAYHLGEPVDAAVLQADHPEYKQLTPAELPGVQVLVDGRDATDAARWAGVRRIVIGRSVRQ